MNGGWVASDCPTEAHTRAVATLFDYVSRLVSWTREELYFLFDMYNSDFAAESALDESATMVRINRIKLTSIVATSLGRDVPKAVIDALMIILDKDCDGIVCFQDWVITADRSLRMPIREHVVMLCEMVKGSLHEKADVGALMRAIAGPLWEESWSECVALLMQNVASADRVALTVGGHPLVHCFSQLIMGVFMPSARDMYRKLKRLPRHTLHAQMFDEEMRGVQETNVASILCCAISISHAMDPVCDFSLKSLTKHRELIEAVVSGVPLNPVPSDWAAVGVPVLLLALRIHLRSYFESVMTQHLSKEIVMSHNRAATLERCLRALPKYHRDMLHTIFATLAGVSRDHDWLVSCSLALGCVVVNPKTTDSSAGHSLESAVSTLIQHWDRFSAAKQSPDVLREIATQGRGLD